MYLTRLLTVIALLTATTGATAAAQTPAQENTLLTYAVSPSPDPLQVSRPGTLRIVVSNSGEDTVRLDSLRFIIEVGNTAQAMANVQTGTSSKIGLDPPDDWTFVEVRTGSFLTSPATAVQVMAQGLVFTMGYIPVGSVAGTTTLTIRERAASGSQAPRWRTTVVQLSKFPVRLAVGDLTASRPRVGFRESVTLTWEGSDTAAYRILYGNETVSIPVKERAWTTPPLEETTTFILVAKGQENGSTIEEHLSITVQVDTPSVRANDLTVRDSSVLRGPVRAMADLRVGSDVRAGGRMYDSAGVVMPPGGIILWAGRTDQVPQGWVLCDGRNGTPDLRGRFVVGWNPADRDYGTVGATGGAAQVALVAAQMPAHAHTGDTGSAGGHDHAMEGADQGSEYRNRNYLGAATVRLYYGGGNDYADPNDVRWRGTARTDHKPDHTHSVTIGSAGGGQAHENRPPYYVLAYIMKL